MNRTPPNGTQAGGAAGGATGGAEGPPTNPRGQNPQGPIVNRGKDVRAALETAERLVAQTTTRLAAEEARATALDQQVQAMQAQGPSILAALDSQTTNKVPTFIWSEWRLTVIAATARIALVDILDLSEVDIPAGGFLYPAVGWG